MKLIALIALAVVILVALVGYLIQPGYLEAGLTAYVDPTGDYHPAKTLWDWMELLIIPVVLAGGGLLYSWRERKAEREIADNRNRETALQNYLDKMTELLLDKGLQTSDADSEVRDLARARTLTILRSLDAERKGLVLQFLHESELINGDKPVISLKGADLSGAKLSHIYLGDANLSEAILTGADLRGTDLVWANLRKAVVDEADFSGAICSDQTVWPDNFIPPSDVVLSDY